MRRRFIDAPTDCRCAAAVTLRDGSKAQCGRRKVHGELCTQHAYLARERKLAQLQARGFDQCAYEPEERAFSVRCSQCEVLGIQGTATHERGCPNARHECKGCNALIPMNQKYCEECQ